MQNRPGKFRIKDHGPYPVVFDMKRLSGMNPYYRTALWTGNCLQVTLMSIPAGGDIGLEMHSDTDQFIYIESGCALVKMGPKKDNLDYRKKVVENCAILVTAYTWHNIINTGRTPLKLFSVYAPPHHPFGTVHKTKQDAEMQESY